MSDEEHVPTPVLRVVRGKPAPDELAALVVVLAARSGDGADDPRPAPSSWAASGRPHGGPVPGPGAWRASALPR